MFSCFRLNAFLKNLTLFWVIQNYFRKTKGGSFSSLGCAGGSFFKFGCAGVPNQPHTWCGKWGFEVQWAQWVWKLTFGQLQAYRTLKGSWQDQFTNTWQYEPGLRNSSSNAWRFYVASEGWFGMQTKAANGKELLWPSSGWSWHCFCFLPLNSQLTTSCLEATWKLHISFMSGLWWTVFHHPSTECNVEREEMQTCIG